MKLTLFATIISIASAFYAPSIFASDFSYSYSNPNDSEAQKYIVEKKNIVIHAELVDVDVPPVGYAWVPAKGGSEPGEIIYHFHFDRKIRSAKLFMQVTSFNWSYSEGECDLYASSDRINWRLLAGVGPPAYGGYKMGTYNAELEGFAGKYDIYLRATVKSYGDRAAEGPPWTNTAQHSRFSVSDPKTTFSLDVDLEKGYFKHVEVNKLFIPGEQKETVLGFYSQADDIDGFLTIHFSDNGEPREYLTQKTIYIPNDSFGFSRLRVLEFEVPKAAKGPNGVLIYTLRDRKGEVLDILQVPVTIDSITDAKTFILMLLLTNK